MSANDKEERLTRALRTKAGMARFLTRLFGPNGWTYDAHEDCWIVNDHQHDGPGHGCLVVQRGGSWRAVVIPDEALQ